MRGEEGPGVCRGLPPVGWPAAARPVSPSAPVAGRRQPSEVASWVNSVVPSNSYRRNRSELSDGFEPRRSSANGIPEESAR